MSPNRGPDGFQGVKGKNAIEIRFINASWKVKRYSIRLLGSSLRAHHKLPVSGVWVGVVEGEKEEKEGERGRGWCGWEFTSLSPPTFHWCFNIKTSDVVLTGSGESPYPQNDSFITARLEGFCRLNKTVTVCDRIVATDFPPRDFGVLNLLEVVVVEKNDFSVLSVEWSSPCELESWGLYTTGLKRSICWPEQGPSNSHFRHPYWYQPQAEKTKRSLPNRRSE